MKTNKLVLLRHGESQWNFENRFTGWTDIGLTKKGQIEAKKSGALLRDTGLEFDLIYTSLLKRAVETTNICLNELSIKDIPIIKDWRLNERHYGALQGLNKAETAKKYGEKKVLNWRRSYDIPPPKLDFNDTRHPRFDPKYKDIHQNHLPDSESLKDTIARILPLWKNKIYKDIAIGQKILLVAHGNSLRGLIKFLDKINNKEILNLNIPTGKPLIYELDNNLNPKKHYYL